MYIHQHTQMHAAKQYKTAGGGWRTTKENVEEDIEVNETMKPSQVSKAISRMKKLLMKKWKKRWIRKLRSKRT